jgi:hypothetical protein
MYTEGLIRNAIASKIYLGRMINSLNTIIMDVSDEPDRAEDVLRAYKLFFDVLQKELEEWRIEKVEIGMALDVTGCGIAKTIEMTPKSFFASFKGRREECTLQDVLEDMYQPEHVIGLVVSAITGQHHRLLIDDLKSGIKYVSDLVANKSKICENSDSLSCVNESDNHVMNVGYSPITREQADKCTGSAPSFDSKKVGESEETSNSREYNDG